MQFFENTEIEQIIDNTEINKITNKPSDLITKKRRLFFFVRIFEPQGDRLDVHGGLFVVKTWQWWVCRERVVSIAKSEMDLWMDLEAEIPSKIRQISPTT